MRPFYPSLTDDGPGVWVDVSRDGYSRAQRLVSNGEVSTIRGGVEGAGPQGAVG